MPCQGSRRLAKACEGLCELLAECFTASTDSGGTAVVTSDVAASQFLPSSYERCNIGPKISPIRPSGGNRTALWIVPSPPDSDTTMMMHNRADQVHLEIPQHQSPGTGVVIENLLPERSPVGHVSSSSDWRGFTCPRSACTRRWHQAHDPVVATHVVQNSKQSKELSVGLPTDVIRILPRCSVPLFFVMESTCNPTVQQEIHVRDPPDVQGGSNCQRGTGPLSSRSGKPYRGNGGAS